MTSSNNELNFFIIRAPRCGTTALSNYLNNHPNILFSKPKETNFWTGQSIYNNYDDYIKNCFPNINKQKFQAIGEGSVSYY